MASKQDKNRRRAERRAQRRQRRLEEWSMTERAKRRQEDPTQQAAFDELVQSIRDHGITQPVEIRPRHVVHLKGVPYVVNDDVEMPDKALRAALLAHDISAAADLLTPLMRALQRRQEITKRVTLLAVSIAVKGLQAVIDAADHDDPESEPTEGPDQGSN